MEIGQKLQTLRRDRGWSQDDVAQRLHVTRQTLSKWELDKSTPDLDSLLALSQLYHVGVDHLLENTKRQRLGKWWQHKREAVGDEAADMKALFSNANVTQSALTLIGAVYNDMDREAAPEIAAELLQGARTLEADRQAPQVVLNRMVRHIYVLGMSGKYHLGQANNDRLAKLLQLSRTNGYAYFASEWRV